MITAQNKQKGIALLTVLLVIVLATIAAVGMTSRQQIDIRRTENILRNEQMQLHRLTAEELAVQLLIEDAKANVTDTLDDNWANANIPLTYEGYLIIPPLGESMIEDMQARFNLNSLWESGKIVTENYERFKRLLSVLDLSPQLADAVVDWLDDNDNVMPYGAEDNYYLNSETPYRAANGEMASISELRYVKGFDAKSYETLKDHICALPGVTAININTAKAAVIASLANGVTLKDGGQLVKDRLGTGGYSINDFINHPIFAKSKPKKSGLAVGSEHFLLSAQVIMGQYQSPIQSLVKRTGTKIVILQRLQGEI